MIRLVESVWSGGGKDLLAALGWCAVRKRELQVLGGELLDVWAADVVDLLDLDDLEDLDGCVRDDAPHSCRMWSHTWMVLKRARWREAMSW